MSESENFNNALHLLRSYAGWQRYYSIRAESLGKLSGFWYYHEDGFFADRVAMSSKKRSSNEQAVTGYTHRLSAQEETQLYADIEAGTVSLARVPNEKYERYYPFQYLY
ncbi:MAG: hypothetical protein ACRYFV_01695 [Janthinobacterium lividum]